MFFRFVYHLPQYGLVPPMDTIEGANGRHASTVPGPKSGKAVNKFRLIHIQVLKRKAASIPQLGRSGHPVTNVPGRA